MQLFVCLFPLKTTLELQLLKIDEMLISKEKDVTEKTPLFQGQFFGVFFANWGNLYRD